MSEYNLDADANKYPDLAGLNDVTNQRQAS